MSKPGRFFYTFFNHNLTVQVQVFNLLAFIGTATGIFVAVTSLFIKSHASIFAVNIIIAAISLSLLLLARKRDCYRLCSWVLVVLIFIIALPALFFFCGGSGSGVGVIFICGVVYTAVLLGKWERVFAVASEFILYISCYTLAYIRPELLTVLPTEMDYFFTSLLNFTTVCALLLILVLICLRIYRIRQHEIQELNSELRAANETLSQYDTMKSDFLATVAHEIKTPLAIIAAGSNDTLDLLMDTPISTGEIKSNQEIIGRKVKLIDNILLDLMDTTAIENGRLSLNRQPVDLRSLIKTICDEQRCKPTSGSLGISCDLLADLPQIPADPVRIEQVIMNLLTNAYHHAKSGVITVTLKHEPAKQVVSVADTGAGMDEETVKAVLKQYVSTKSDYWRHGIGLLLCRRIIDAHGGEIWIESKVGAGTTVYFSLSEETGNA